MNLYKLSRISRGMYLMSKLTDIHGDATEFVAVKDSYPHKAGDRLTLDEDDESSHPHFTNHATNETVCTHIGHIKPYVADPAENSTQKQKYAAFEWLRGESLSDGEHSEHAAVLMYELLNLKRLNK